MARMRCAAGPASGLGGPPKHLSAELISEESTIAPGKPFRVAVRLEHEEHWHSYGKVIPEGVTGKPTRIIWTLPDGWKADDLPWPPTKKVPPPAEPLRKVMTASCISA